MISQSTIQQVCEIPIEEVVAAVIDLKKSGSSSVALCPFHQENTPSFHIWKQKNRYHCFGCDGGGNVIDFVMNYEGLNFPEAVKSLANQHAIEIIEENKLSPEEIQKRSQCLRLGKLMAEAVQLFKANLSENAQCYLLSRGLDEEIIERLDIGWADESVPPKLKTLGYSDQELSDCGLIRIIQEKHSVFFHRRIVFPIYNLQATPVAFIARTITGANPKYLNSPATLLYNKSRDLMGLQQAKAIARKENNLYLCEGPFDSAALNMHGIDNAAALCGTALTENHLRQIKRYTQCITLVCDGDNAGKRATAKAIDLASSCNMTAKVVVLPENTDPADLLIQ